MEIQVLESVGIFGTAIATIALVILLWKAVRQMEATVSLSKVQTDLRFRAWVGPSSGIIPRPDGNNSYEIAIKNFGEIPSESVRVLYKLDTKPMEKNEVNSYNDTFDLGPLLPNMEKHYWFIIESDLIEKAKKGQEKIFVLLYFEYQVALGKSGYGMISEYKPEKENFVHKNMWIVNPENKKPS